MGANKGLYGLPPGPAPASPIFSGIKPGLVYGTGYAGSGLIKNGVRWWAPLWIPAGCRVDACVVNVITLDAGGVVRMGIYASDGKGHPESLLVDAGLASMASTGEKVLSFRPIGLATGAVWVVLHQTGGPAGAVACHSNSTVMFPSIGQSSTTPGTFAVTGLSETLASDAPLPRVAPKISALSADRNAPLMTVRVA